MNGLYFFICFFLPTHHTCPFGLVHSSQVLALFHIPRDILMRNNQIYSRLWNIFSEALKAYCFVSVLVFCPSHIGLLNKFGRKQIQSSFDTFCFGSVSVAFFGPVFVKFQFITQLKIRFGLVSVSVFLPKQLSLN